MKKDIFISYENEGLHLAMLLSNSLNENGYDVYFNPNELNSVAFPNRLRHAVESCKDFLLILTQSCLERVMDENIIYWVREELFIAHRSGKNIIPIIMPNVVMPNDEDNIPENLKFLLRLDRLCIIQQSKLDKIIESVVEMLTSVPSNFSHNQEQKYIFISYSHKDSDIVVPIIKKMKSYGYSVWYDDGIDPGTEWDKNIAEHVESCGYFIAFMSENYINSSNCKDELNFARDLEKKRFLVYIEEVDLPSEMKMRLSRIQNIHKYKYENDKDFYNKFFSADGLFEFKDEIRELSKESKSQIESEAKKDELQSLKSLFLVENPIIAIDDNDLLKIIEGNNYKLHRFHGEINDFKDYAENYLKKVLKESSRIAFNIHTSASEKGMEVFYLAESMILESCINKDSIISWGFVDSSKLKLYEIEVDIIASNNQEVFEVGEKNDKKEILITAEQQERLNLYLCGLCGMSGRIKRDSIGYYVECSHCEANSTIADNIDEAIDNWELCSLYDKISRNATEVMTIKETASMDMEIERTKQKKNGHLAFGLNDVLITKNYKQQFSNPISLCMPNNECLEFEFIEESSWDKKYIIVSRCKSKDCFVFSIFKNPEGTANPPVAIFKGKKLKKIYRAFMEQHKNEYEFTDEIIMQPNIQPRKSEQQRGFTEKTASGMFGPYLRDVIEIPPKYTFVDSHVFYYTNTSYSQNKISKLIIPNSVTKIEDFAFSDIIVSEIRVPDSVTEIGYQAFNLTSDGFIVCTPDSYAYKYAKYHDLKNSVDIANDYKIKGVCAYCGGRFSGLFKKKCSLCGKEKDY